MNAAIMPMKIRKGVWNSGLDMVFPFANVNAAALRR